MTAASAPMIATPPIASRYRAFISYSHADESWAKWIEAGIESYSVPRKMVGRQTKFGPLPSRVRPVFRDRDQLAAGPDLSATIRGALCESLFLIVICSPKAAASTWVNEEIRLFKGMGLEDRILCLLVVSKTNA